MKITKTVLSATMAAALLAGSAVAQTPAPSTPAPDAPRAGKRFEGKGFKKMRKMHARRMAAALNLTDAQKQQLQTLRQRHRDANQGLRTEVRTLRTQLREATQAGNTAQIQALSERLGAAQGKARIAGLAARNEFLAVLTPEQKTKLEQLREQRKGRIGEGGGMRHMHRG